MNRSGFFFLIFAIVIAITFTWLNSTWLSFKAYSLISQEKQIDYYLTDFSILNTYPDGNMKYQLNGQHLVHQQSNNASKIIKPIIKARDINNSIVSITANEAIQNTKNGPILLAGSIIVEKESHNIAENFQLLSSNLSYNPVSRELSTDAALIFKSSAGNLEGVGFSTKLNEQELRIHKNVRAKFIPSQQQ